MNKIIVYTFRDYNVDHSDYALSAAGVMAEWRHSEVGEWVFGRSLKTPEWTHHLNFDEQCYQYIVWAWLMDVDISYFLLKWGDSIQYNRT